jgi:hypothetical protein
LNGAGRSYAQQARVRTVNPLESIRESVRESVKAFVQHGLGCECPDAVFEDIEFRRLDGGTGLRLDEMIVGRRLLIYIAQAPAGELLDSHLAELLSRGRRERDEKAYHRFRLVVVGDPAGPLGQAAEDLFHRSQDRDERVHLHVLGTQAVPDLGRLQIDGGAPDGVP